MLKIQKLRQMPKKTKSDVAFSMSYVEKNMSDVEKTTSDLVFHLCKAVKSPTLQQASFVKTISLGKRFVTHKRDLFRLMFVAGIAHV